MPLASRLIGERILNLLEIIPHLVPFQVGKLAKNDPSSLIFFLVDQNRFPSKPKVIYVLRMLLWYLNVEISRYN